MPKLEGVNVECRGPAGNIVSNHKVLKDGQCTLNCEEEGLKVVEAYEILKCMEKEGHLTFTRKNDSKPIVRETLKNLDLCPGRAPDIYVRYKGTLPNKKTN